MTSGRISDIIAWLAASEPTSSSAIRFVFARRTSIAAIRPAGSLATDRSVTSATICSSVAPRVSSSIRSVGHGVRELAGSTLTNSGMSAGYRAANAPRTAAARQIQSSSGSRPTWAA